MHNHQGSGAQQGFTLIELIIVIVILGILAVTAAPKFIDISGDARSSTLNGLAGAIVAANNLANIQSKLPGRLIQGNTNAYLDSNKNGVYDAPDGVSTDMPDLLMTDAGKIQSRAIGDAIDMAGFLSQTINTTTVYIGTDLTNTGKVSDDNCYLSYSNDADTEIVTTGC